MDEHSDHDLDESTTTRRAVRFGWVSLFQDLGSKMVVPIVPLFLTLSLGAGPLVVGLVDGLASAIVAVVAPVAGRATQTRAPLPLVRLGYGLSSVMKLALAAATSWGAVLGVRVLDRVGKGVRDAPRDVILASGPPATRGRTYGIQQAMDKAGGFLGPLAGLAIYELTDGSFRWVFAIASVPCLISVALLWGVPGVASRRPSPPAADATSSPSRSAGQRIALTLLTLHTLTAVPVALIIVRATDIGLGVGGVLVAFAGHRLATALAAYPAGALADRRSPAISVALGIAIVAAGLGAAAADHAAGVWVALVALGVGDALTRGPAKAWLVSLGPAEGRGAVLGDRAALSAVAGLAGGIVYGALWEGAWWGDAPTTTSRGSLLVAAVVTVGIAVAVVRCSRHTTTTTTVTA
ncbi:MAG: MFS transporter [Actinomycetota bacterium]